MGSDIIHGRVQGTLDVLSGGKRVNRDERNAVIETLAHAVTKDYMDQPTYEARVEAALNARSQHELERLTADLPAQPPKPRHLALRLAGWAVPLLASLFVMVPAPIWVYTSTQQTFCSGANNCWTQHSGAALAATFGLVIFGIIGVIITVATFVAWMDANEKAGRSW